MRCLCSSPYLTEPVAYVATDIDFDFDDDDEHACFYCGEEPQKSCEECGQKLCTACGERIHCRRYLPDDEYVTLNNFSPKPDVSKKITTTANHRRK